jgi:hypothetical protein
MADRSARPPAPKERPFALSRSQSLRPARDTILSQRAARPAAAQKSDPATQSTAQLAAATALVAATSFTVVLARHVIELASLDSRALRTAVALVPLVVGILAVLIVGGRGIDRGRALATAAVVATLCPLFAYVAGIGVGLAMITAAAMAFIAVPLALDWIGSRGLTGAAPAGLIAAASQLGPLFGNQLPSDLPLPVGAIGLLILVIPAAVIAVRLRRKGDAIPHSATWPPLVEPAMAGLLVASILAAAAGTAMLQTFALVGTTAEADSHARVYVLMAVLIGGALADQRERDARGYAVWLAGLFGLAALALGLFVSERLDFDKAEYALNAARILTVAGFGPALAILFRLAPPSARLGGMTAYLVVRVLGAGFLGGWLSYHVVDRAGLNPAHLAAVLLALAAAILMLTRSAGRTR